MHRLSEIKKEIYGRQKGRSVKLLNSHSLEILRNVKSKHTEREGVHGKYGESSPLGTCEIVSRFREIEINELPQETSA